MKNWKRLVALGMSAMMIASLAGCSTTKSTEGGSEGGEAAAPAESGGGKNLWREHMYLCSNPQVTLSET